MNTVTDTHNGNTFRYTPFDQFIYASIEGKQSTIEALPLIGVQVAERQDSQKPGVHHIQATPEQLSLITHGTADVKIIQAHQHPGRNISYLEMSDSELAQYIDFVGARGQWLRHCDPSQLTEKHDIEEANIMQGQISRDGRFKQALFEKNQRIIFNQIKQQTPALQDLSLRTTIKGSLVWRLIEDQHGNSWGQDAEMSKAIASAINSRLSYVQAWQQTPDQFNQNTLIVPVILGRGKTGAAQNGKPRFLIDNEANPNTLDQMRKEFSRAYEQLPPDHPALETPKETFISNSMSHLLSGSAFNLEADEKTGNCVWAHMGFDAKTKNFIFTTKPQLVARNINSFHESCVQEAFDQDLPVPNEVLEHYPDIAQSSQNQHQRQSA